MKIITKTIILALLLASPKLQAIDSEKDKISSSLPAIIYILLSEDIDPCAEYESLPPVEGEPPVAIDPPEECGGKPIFLEN